MITNRDLPAGIRLTGTHKGVEHTLDFVGGVFILDGGRGAGAEFKSISAAGGAATGQSTNGWAFWSRPDEPQPVKGERTARAPRTPREGRVRGSSVPHERRLTRKEKKAAQWEAIRGGKTVEAEDGNEDASNHVDPTKPMVGHAWERANICPNCKGALKGGEGGHYHSRPIADDGTRKAVYGTEPVCCVCAVKMGACSGTLGPRGFQNTRDETVVGDVIAVIVKKARRAKKAV
jgi:hypothetical protein